MRILYLLKHSSDYGKYDWRALKDINQSKEIMSVVMVQ